MKRTHVSQLLLVISIVYVVAFYFIGSAIKPGYSQVSNFVSEYGAVGTAWASELTYAGYLVTALLLASFLLSAAPIIQVSGASRFGFWMLWSVPGSFLLAVVAPCDLGCPAEGSLSQNVHNALAVLTYAGMGLGLALISMAPRLSSFPGRRMFMLLVGAAFPVMFVLMVQPDLAAVRGLLQRALDVALAFSLILVAVTLLADPSRSSTSSRHA